MKGVEYLTLEFESNRQARTALIDVGRASRSAMPYAEKRARDTLDRLILVFDDEGRPSYSAVDVTIVARSVADMKKRTPSKDALPRRIG